MQEKVKLESEEFLDNNRLNILGILGIVHIYPVSYLVVILKQRIAAQWYYESRRITVFEVTKADVVLLSNPNKLSAGIKGMKESI